MAGNVKYQKIIKYLVSAVCTQPLHIGSASGDKEEVLIHPVDGFPFLQASGISGALREFYAKTQDEAHAEKMFGSRRFEEGGNSMDGASKVRFSDGNFRKDKKPVLELRPRVSIDPKTGTSDASTIKGTDKQAGHKFNMEYIGAGAEFQFAAYLYDESLQEDLEALFAAVHQGNVQFGGQKSNGCGFLSLSSLKRKIFDMTDAGDRGKWADEEELADEEYTALTDESGVKGHADGSESQTGQSVLRKDAAKTKAAYEIRVTGVTEGELLVKSIAVQDYGKDAPDSMNIRNAAKEYIVPGSSLKGAVRSQMEKIASYIGCKEVIRDTFGDTGNALHKGKAGNIIFYDTVVGNKEDNDCARIRNRIHIDKFTGGVIHGGLFNEKNVSGQVEFHIVINDRNCPDRTCGLLLMALRDMALGLMSVGGGYNVGKGIIDVGRISIHDCRTGDTAEIDFKESGGEAADDKELISRCICALHKRARCEA